VIRQMIVELADGNADLAHLFIEQVLRKSFTRTAPFDLLFRYRDLLEVLLELRVAQRLGHVADAPVPADGRDAPAEVFVDPLGPDAHLGAIVGIVGPQLDCRWVRVLEVLADYRAFGHDAAAVVERRNLSARIDRLEPVAVMLELRWIEPMDGEVPIELELLEERQHGLERVGHGAETVEFEHGAVPLKIFAQSL